MYSKRCPTCSREMGLTEIECYACRAGACTSKQRPKPEPDQAAPTSSRETISPKLILPCAVCGTRYKAIDVSQRTCGPACESAYESRERSRKRILSPGHTDFVASTSKDALRHDRAVRRKLH